MKTIQRTMPVCLLLIATVWAAGIPAHPASASAPTPQPTAAPQRATDLRSVPFVKNIGQIKDGDVRFCASMEYGAVYVTGHGEIVYALRSQVRVPSVGLAGPERQARQLATRYAIKESLLESAAPQVAGQGRFPAKISDFRGSNPATWQADIPAFTTVTLGEVYPGVVLDLQAAAGNVEKLFRVRPGADPACIRLAIEGVESLAVNLSGELETATPLGAITFTKPFAYQMGTERIEPVEVAYAVDGNAYGFVVGDYDRSRELIIDPLLASTFLGGGQNEIVQDMLLDSAGHVYVTGWTGSTDFPATIGAYDTSYDNFLDVFVAKFDASLQNLLACTYLGGGANDQDATIGQDDEGHIFILGRTSSSDFPTTPGAFDTTFSGWANCFVVKLDSDLQNLLAATYLGGNSATGDGSADILIAADGVVYVTGLAGLNFPTTLGAYAETISSWTDGYVAKLSNNLENLLAATFLGGDAADVPDALALDDEGNIVVAGHTQSWDFPITAGAFDPTHNGDIYDVFLAKLDPDLQSLLASTFVGGGGNDTAEDLVRDGAGNFLVTGVTYSANYPVTAAAFDPTYGGSPDAYVSLLNSGFTDLLASTFLGGTGYDWGYALAVNARGSVFVSGTTSAADFPVTPGAYDSSLNGGDVFVAKLNLGLTSLRAATYLGGTASDTGYALAVDAAGDVYVGGETGSANFPTSPGCYDGGFNGSSGDAFITKLDRSLSDDMASAVGEKLPLGYALGQNNPNPFNPVTTVGFETAAAGRVTLTVYDLLGREVAKLVNEELAAGCHEAKWNAAQQASGMYIYRLTVVPSGGRGEGISAVRKMQLVR